MTTPAPDPAVPDRAVPDPSWDRLDRRAAVLAAALYTAGPVVGGALLTAYWVAVGTSLGTALAWTVPPSVLAVAVGAGCGEWMWRVTRYHVDTDRLHVHTGVVFRKRLALRRERIRSVDLTADPVLRVLGVATVRVGTGEHAGAEGTVTLWPLRRDAADALRATLLAHAARPVPDAEPADGALARFDPRWIRYAPLSFVPPALGAAAAGGVIQVSEWFGRQDDLFAAVGSWFGLAPVLLVALALLAGLLLVGAVAALALWVETWWNHTLDREADGTLRVRRGLLTTRSISLEESRLRGIELVEPLGVRLAGAARVDAVATGLTTSEEDKSESRTLLPAAPKELADQVAAAVLREPAAPTAAPLAGHPLAARGRRVRWALAPVLAVEAVLVMLGLLLTPVLLHVAWISALVLVPVAVALALDAYRALGHALTGAYLVARSGTVRRSTVALQRRGIVGWTVRQSVFQRRAGLVTVLATTAAGTGAYAVRDAGQADGLALADAAVPDLLRPFLLGADDAPARVTEHQRP
ncbi:PH domain-containing protein [Promicromonospora thailandica]|uniref:Membrane protein n=1 Tax=Promicromonospora thailandica TaxID=765201 RepID=A0A9X2JWF1_9MICO|nr:PH domain-containing protein [Promicromonospora thailandica]MCP2266535.1 putative membrane protein [Promicromonospora thailandica]